MIGTDETYVLSNDNDTRSALLHSYFCGEILWIFNHKYSRLLLAQRGFHLVNWFWVPFV